MSSSSKDNLIKFLLMGTLLFLLSFSGTLADDLRHTLFLQEGGKQFLPFGPRNFAASFVIFSLFLVFYRKHRLPRFFFASVVGFLGFLSFSCLWGLPHGSESVRIGGYMLMTVWPSLASASFWVLANQIYTLKEAKLAYPLLLFIFPTLSLIAGGQTISHLSQVQESMEMLRLFGFLLSGILAFFMMSFWALTKKGYTVLSRKELEKKASPAFNMGYLTLVLIMTTAFGLCNHLATMPFKKAVANAFPDPVAYIQFMGEYSQYVGIAGFALFPLIFLLIWKGGWFKSALMVPCVIILTTAGLLLCCYYPQAGDYVPQVFEGKIAPLTHLLVAQSILIKGLGGLFFIVQNLAFIPLALAVKARGKMAISFLFGGSATVLVQFILMFFDTIPVDAHLEEFLMIILGIAGIWLISVLALGRMFKRIAD